MADEGNSGRAYDRVFLSPNASMLGAGAAAAAERTRENRRRRFLMRRRANQGGAGFGYPWVAQAGMNDGLLNNMERMHIGGPVAARGPMLSEAEAEMRNPVPVVGAIAVAGQRCYMEDAVGISTRLCSPAINGFVPVHYFGVFDGHGGSHFAIMCKKMMHEILVEELMHPNQMCPIYPAAIADGSALQETWRRLMMRCFVRTETMALQTCPCGSVGFVCRCGQPAEFFSGTTAVTVLLTEKHIVVSNCGDSRAVLYRGGRIIPLTFEHKPDRADEMARIEARGGRVLRTDTARVEGILAMSRALGDTYLKPLVISEPEVTFTRRDDDDEFIILASDGLWDVLPVQMVCQVARECLISEPGDIATIASQLEELGYGADEIEELATMSPSRSSVAATLLTRLAVARDSRDNISVVVVDLTRVSNGEPVVVIGE